MNDKLIEAVLRRDWRRVQKIATEQANELARREKRGQK